ncbi:MAG: ThiF family adenylyltransferase [Candidatus Paceibacterota bacterium]|jgi:molybdopterin/thiamine biosynthesis adenylyltransferase
MEQKNEYRPKILNKKEAEKLMKQKHINFVDAFSHQLKELFIIKNPLYAGPKKTEGYKTKEFTNFSKKMENKYTYVFYPWNFSLVKTVKKEDYLELKTNRNRDLITKEEQERLRNTKVAVFGMSVGSNISLVLTQAGISNEIIIADFDDLDTTNLNRIIAGAHQIGLNKTIIAARRIYEDNPFAKVTTLPDGASKENIEKLLKAKKIDLIIEEVDSLPFKIEARELAIKYKVPVIMITDNGDGVVLHVERYDLGYKKIFDKDISYWKNILSQPPSMEMMGNVIMNDIVGGIKNIDPRTLRSVEKVLKKELVSWSQLGSAAILGGVVATVMLKKIINKEDNNKYIVKNIFVL